MRFEYKFGTDYYLLVVEDDVKLQRAIENILVHKYKQSFDEVEVFFKLLDSEADWLDCLEDYRSDLKEYFRNEAEMEYEFEQRKMEEIRDVERNL